MKTQQPVEISQKDAAELIVDERFCAQEKLDGKRCVIFCERGNLRAESRSEREMKLPAKVRAQMPVRDFIIDGELVGDDFTAFDIVSIDGESVEVLPYSHRLEMLASLGAPMIETSYSSEDKAALLARVRKASGEGGVFKRLSAKYKFARAFNDQFKFKFWRSDSFVVTEWDGFSAVHISRRGINAGKVAVLGYRELPKIGNIIEVKFQERTAAGKLRHPQFIGVRDDLTLADV